MKESIISNFTRTIHINQHYLRKVRYVLALLIRDKSISQKPRGFGRDSPSLSTLTPIQASVNKEEGELAVE